MSPIFCRKSNDTLVTLDLIHLSCLFSTDLQTVKHQMIIARFFMSYFCLELYSKRCHVSLDGILVSFRLQLINVHICIVCIKEFKFIAAFSLSSYFNAFVCNFRLSCPWCMLGCHFYNAFCVDRLYAFIELLTHSLFILIIVLHHV